MDKALVVEAVAKCLVRAGSTFPDGRMRIYEQRLAEEENETARWILQTLIDNARAAAEQNSPLCDDTGIPHVVIDVGPNAIITSELLQSIELGVAEGLRRLPGRPMAVKGDGDDRLGQTLGMYDDPSLVVPAPPLIRQVAEDGLRIHVLLLGGGPAIRGWSKKVFHRHDAREVEAQIIEWAGEMCAQLGCTPCTLAVGIGRSHYEAASMMLQAQVDGDYDAQTPMEQRITRAVNQSGVGPMGIGGDTSVLATFIKIGPARASGVRIVCMRPCCCMEPRIASVDICGIV